MASKQEALHSNAIPQHPESCMSLKQIRRLPSHEGNRPSVLGCVVLFGEVGVEAVDERGHVLAVHTGHTLEPPCAVRVPVSL